MTDLSSNHYQITDIPTVKTWTQALIDYLPFVNDRFYRQPQEEKDELNQVVINFILSYLESKGATLIDEKICVHEGSAQSN